MQWQQAFSCSKARATHEIFLCSAQPLERKIVRYHNPTTSIMDIEKSRTAIYHFEKIS